MSNVPSYAHTLEPSVDPVLEAAKRKFPPPAEEIDAERAMNGARVAYDDFLMRATKSMVDAGAGEGVRYGFGYADPKFDTEREEAETDLQRATVRFHKLVRDRQARIQREVELVGAKEAAEAQKAWQRRHGISR